MAFFTAAEYGTVDPATAHIHTDVLNVGPSVEIGTRITLACAEEVASYRMTADLFQSTRHTQGTATHDDDSRIHHIGGLATAVYIGEDVTTGDLYLSLAVNLT